MQQFNRVQRQALKLGLVFAASLAVSSSVKGELICYEGFDYTNGTSIAYASGGTNWGAWWVGGDTAGTLATNTSVGLGYGGLATIGGALIIGKPDGTTTTTAQPQRQLPGTLTSLAGGSGTLWVSFLYQNFNDDVGSLAGFRETGLRMIVNSTTNAGGWSKKDGSSTLKIGSPNTYITNGAGFDELALWTDDGYSQSGIPTPRGSDPHNTVFMLMRIDLDDTAALDTAYAWFNPDLSSEPPLSAAITNSLADLSPTTAFRFQAGNANSTGSNAVFIIDEIRLGTTFADVTPPAGVVVSGPKWLSPIVAGSSISLQLTGAVSTVYDVTAASAVTDASPWEVIGSLTTDETGLGSFVDTNTLATNIMRFYRAKEAAIAPD